LIDYVVLEGKPLLLHTQEEIADFLKHRTLGIPGDDSPSTLSPVSYLAAWLGIPIMVSDAIFGVIVVQSSTPYGFNEDDRRFLSTVSSHAAVAISNARLFSERERRLREITVLKDVGNAISSTLDLQGSLERLCYELGQAVDMSTSLIGIYDEKTNVLSYPVCYDQDQRIYLEPAPLGEGPTAWAIRNRQPLLLLTSDQAKQMGLSEFGYSVFDVRSGQSRIRLPRSRTVESAIVTPIISNETVLGVISIKSYRPYAFDEDDLRFVMTVANQLGVTITNIFMFQEREQRIKELATFNEIGQALSSTVKIDDLPMLIYRQTSRLLDTTNFYMVLFDEEKAEISFPLFCQNGEHYTIEVMRQQDSYAAALPHIPINPGLYKFILYLIRRVIYKRESLLLRGSDLDHVDLGNIDELQEEVGVVETSFSRPRSWLGVPMIVTDKVVGVIGIQDYQDTHAYGNYDAHLLSTIASWAAIALENARLFEQIRNLAANLEQRVADRTLELEKANVQLIQEKDYLQTIHSITLELTATLNLSKIINRALEVASTNLDVARGSIMLRELQSGTLMCRAVLQDQGDVQTAEVPIRFAKGEGLAGWVMQHQEAVCIDDVTKDSRWVVETGRADDVRSVVAVPLMTNDTTLGVIILSSPQENYFSESQVRLLATIANEVAIAINNAQLYTYINEMANRLADLLEQQKEEATRSHAILQSLTEGVIVLDEENHIQLMNWAAVEMLGIPAEDVLQKPVTMLETYGKTAAEFERASILCNNLLTGLEKVRELQNSYNISIEFPYPVQTIAMNVAQVVDLEGRWYGDVAVLRDITREIESDRTKREFIANVSHELRTPLTVIKGFVDVLLLQSEGSLNENQQRSLTTVKTNSNRLNDLINDILEISQLESGKITLNFEQVALPDIITDVVQSLQLETQAKQLSVSVKIADSLPMIEADTKRLTQIVFNLFSNAVKYTFEGGHIQVRASLNPAQMIQVDIEDTGVGMTPEQCSKLFQPFYRADNPLRDVAGGTGLGLSITKSLVEQHGGELWVTSEQNKGSIFSFILPLTQPEEGDDEVDGDNV
jgi:signal transduction histidine kinase